MGRAWRTDATFNLSDTKGTVLADYTFSYATAEPSLPSLGGIFQTTPQDGGDRSRQGGWKPHRSPT